MDGKVSNSVLLEGQCVGIIRGLNYLAGLLRQEQRSCSPQGVTVEQLVRVVVVYIERRPQRMHEDFKELTLDALHDAWPCR